MLILKQILRFDHWEYFISWVRTMLDALDVANVPTDTDEATELPSSLPVLIGTSTIHTKLGSPKHATTLEEFMRASAGPGSPLPRVFQQKLEALLNTSDVTNRAHRKEYLRLRKEDRVIGSILIQSSYPQIADTNMIGCGVPIYTSQLRVCCGLATQHRHPPLQWILPWSPTV